MTDLATITIKPDLTGFGDSLKRQLAAQLREVADELDPREPEFGLLNAKLVCTLAPGEDVRVDNRSTINETRVYVVEG